MNRVKKILYLSDTPHMDGSGIALLNIVSTLHKTYHIQIVFPRTGPLYIKLNEMGICCKIVTFYLDIYPRIKNKKDFIMFIPRLIKLLVVNYHARYKLVKIIQEYQPDIVHTNVGPIHLGFNATKKTNTPHVWHIREYQNIGFGWTPLFSMKHFIKKLNFHRNYKIAVSTGLSKYFNMNERSTVIYDGVFSDKHTPAIIKEKDKYFLFVGRIEPAKGISELIDAFKEFSQLNNFYRLLIAGQGVDNFVKQIKEKVDKSKLNNQIEFLGFRNDINKLMSRAIALIVPSRFEGFGFITAEAMYNGCLVIGKDVAGTKEQFDNGLCMNNEEIGIRYHTHQELVKSLIEVSSKEFSHYLPMIKKAQNTVIKLYSIERSIKEITNLYDLIVEKNKI